ncbi:P-loop ATPase, Sll1717 family [Candidatus Enterovibrio escicola]|uniref:P-loop ATPase, Sll1717 family n=1 Tax=Candidatus Enterovibrio escicola TaxID=1927127 RepID=UPI0012383160|nr:cold shock domain-containing protein [Candidatus Enterovibrio escacola]
MGKINWYNGAKGFGFITRNSGEELFFHISDFKTNSDIRLKRGLAVKYDIGFNEKGEVAKNICLLEKEVEYTGQVQIGSNTITNNDRKFGILEILSKWKLDAKHDEMGRNYFHIKQEKAILEGTKSFVIGRKGTGKTALSESIYSQSKHNTFSQKLTFKNFPFNDLYTLENKDYTRPNQYISLWKYLIYSSICKMMIDNNAIDSEVRATLSELFSSNTPLNNLKKSIKQWTAKDVSLKFMGVGGKIGVEKNEQSWIDRLDVLEEVIEAYLDNSNYYIVFDELDEDYKNIVEMKQQADYISLITSLFKAVQDVRSIFSSLNFNIKPIVFLRDDIYDLILDSDKNKWEDFRVDLEWNIKKIQDLLAYRISKANEHSDSIKSFNQAWNMVFEASPVKMGDRGRKKLSIFEYITRSTHLRPRDYVRYIQVAADDSLQHGRDVITANTVKKVDKGFSNYLRNELVDEIHGIIPDIQEIFSIISEIRKQVFSVTEFKNVYKARLEKDLLVTKDADYVLKTLFHFSVIGNLSKGGVDFFRYSNKEARFNFKESIIVHRGLFKALQII